MDKLERLKVLTGLIEKYKENPYKGVMTSTLNVDATNKAYTVNILDIYGECAFGYTVLDEQAERFTSKHFFLQPIKSADNNTFTLTVPYDTEDKQFHVQTINLSTLDDEKVQTCKAEGKQYTHLV